MKRKRSYLKGQDVGIGGMDDSFYFSELYLKKTGGAIGKRLGLTPKQSLRKNKLLKNLHELESKGHFTHSPAQRNSRFLHSFSKPLLDTKISKLKRVLMRFPKHY